jgi:aspartyl-tRNA synthetase
VVNDAIGALRVKIGHSEFGKKNGLFDDAGAAVGGRLPDVRIRRRRPALDALHHPFTAPKDGHEDFISTNPGAAIAKAYDMVLNGWELGGGSVRIHRADVQSKVFRALKIDDEEARLKFGFLLDALQYGAPHGGIGLRPGPHRHHDDRRRVDPRRDRLPQDPARPVPADHARRKWTRSSCASCTSACAIPSRQ